MTLGGLYTEIEGEIGHIDGTTKGNTTIQIICDGALKESFSLAWDSGIQRCKIDVTNVNTLKIVVPNNNGQPDTYYGFGDVKIR